MENHAGAASAPATSIASARTAANDLRRGRGLAWSAVALFAVLAWFAVPHGIGFSWRECDTQAIARNFVADGFDPLRPRIDWRGDGDGAVECEFPLFQLGVGAVLRMVGDAEWPGRLLALLATAWAALALHRLLETRSGPGGALAGLLVFLTSGSAVMLATRVMPDAVSLAFGLAAVLAFVRYLAGGRAVALWASMAALALAGLQKPLALQFGLVLFGWAALAAPRRLREPRLWCGFAGVLAVVAAWLWHGKALHDETGLTFGVLGGGDTKFPDLAQLLSPKVHAQLAWTTVQYGLSAAGVLGAFALLVRRRFDRSDAVLLLAVAIGLYVSLRYSYHHRMGPHYHMFAAAAGAYCVARAWPAVAGRWLWGAVLAAVVLQGAWRFAVEHEQRRQVVETPLMDLAASLRRLAQPDELVVVRGEKPRRDPVWNRTNNFEDPRLLYQARLRGWVVPVDGFGVDALASLHRRGARLVYDPLPGATGPDVERWLEEHGEPVLELANGRVYRLHDGD